MGERNREFLCFVVDVGPHMHALLPHVEEYLLCSMEAKLLNKPTHEVALLVFGSTETTNDPHTEAELKAEQDQYMHIAVQHNYRLPNLDTLRTATSLPRGAGYSDTLDALTVAADMVVKADAERILGKTPKRVVLISNFKGKGKGWDPDFMKYVVETFMAQHVKLEVLHLDLDADNPATGATTSQDDAGSQTVRENLDGICKVLQDMGGTEPMSVRSIADLAMAVRWVEVMPVTTYRGPLSIGKKTRIPVRVYKKVSRETLPSLKDYVVTEPGAETSENASELTFKTSKSRAYNVEGNKGEIVDESETAQAHKYGRSCIPVDESTEALLKYSVMDKGMWLWGFMPAAQVKRFAYMSESLVVVPDPSETGSGHAVSALVRAMHKENQVAVVRYVARANSRPHLLVLSPLLGSLRRPDAWVANHLPFEQDLKWIDFPPLGSVSSVTPDQRAAADALVESMQLIDGEGRSRELLVPDTTPNPVLRRFYVSVAQQAMHPGQELQVHGAETDALVQAVSLPPRPALTRSEAARKRMREVFTTTELVRPKPEEQDPSKRARSAFGGAEDEDAIAPEGTPGAGAGGAASAGGAGAVQHVGTATPEDDLAALIAAGKAKTAVSEMREVIFQLVDDSVGSRNYDKAAGCEAALRRACVDHGLAADYNQHLQGLVSRYKHHEAHAPFFSRLMAAQVSLISDTEAPGAEGAVSPQEAAAFARSHTAPSPEAMAPPPAAEVGDDFDEME